MTIYFYFSITNYNTIKHFELFFKLFRIINRMLMTLFFVLNLLAFENSFAEKIDISVCANDVRKSINPNKKYETPSEDIIKIAFERLKNKLEVNYSIDFKPMDRCIADAERGHIDAVLDISYTAERAEAVEYPPHSGPEEKEGPCSSTLKMTCSRYVVITTKKSNFDYKGDQNNLPIPVRIARGYSLAKKIEAIYKENAELSKNDLINIKKLLRDKTGCVVANFGYIPGLAENQFRENIMNLKIHKIPYEARSNYFTFSKKAKYTKEQKMLIWQELSKIMLDQKIVTQLRKKFSKINYK